MLMKLGTWPEEVKADGENAGINPEASHIGHRGNRRDKPVQEMQSPTTLHRALGLPRARLLVCMRLG